jgi:probable HAF family extracellular repeat protein
VPSQTFTNGFENATATLAASIYPAALNADGAAAAGSVGFRRSGTLLFSNGELRMAFRWTASGGTEILQGLSDEFVSGATVVTPGSPTISQATDLNADGSVVTGSATVSGYGALYRGYFARFAAQLQAFRWTGGTMVSIGSPGPSAYLAGGRTRQAGSLGVAISADGLTIGGNADDFASAFRAGAAANSPFVWSQASGFTLPGAVAGSGGRMAGQLTDLSANGQVAVGIFNALSAGPSATPYLATQSTYAYRWTAAGGAEFLGGVPNPTGGRVFISPLGVSADGNRIVLNATAGATTTSYVWSPQTGLVTLASQMAAGGVTIPATATIRANGLSNDGTFFFGDYDDTANSLTQHFVMRLIIPDGPAAAAPAPLAAGPSHVDFLSRISATATGPDLTVLGSTAALESGDFGGPRVISAGISANGAAIVGSYAALGGDGTTLPRRAFRWTQADGFTDLGSLAGVLGGSVAEAGDFDGDTITGTSEIVARLSRAFRWRNGTMTDLGALIATGNSSGVDISLDGEVVVARRIN